MLCIYFSFYVQCTLTLLLPLKQTPTDRSYKQVSRKKTNQELRNNGTNLTAIQQNSGETVAVTTQKFSPSGILWASPQHYNAIFFILVFIFHFYKYFYIFFCIL